MWYIHTVKYYSVIKKNEIKPFAATWMDLEIITLSEISQRKTNIIWYVESKKKNFYKWKEIGPQTENKLMVTKGEREKEINEEFRINVHIWLYWASLMAQIVKNLPAMCETWVQTLGWEDPLEEGMATHSSILAWRIPMNKGAWRAQSMGSQRVRHD